MSEHDERWEERTWIGGLLIADVCAIADKPFVESVENNFAGYFNELGITVHLRPDCSDELVVALQNELLGLLNSRYEAKSDDFSWVVRFTRAGKVLRSIFPGDAPRRGAEDLVPEG